MDSSLITSLLLIGFATGMTTGVTGASGVAVIVPLLAIILRVEVHEAIAISLMVDIIASAVIAATYYRHGHLRLGSGIWIGLGAIFGAQAGALFAQSIPEDGLGVFFGLFMIVTGIVMWMRHRGRTITSKTLDNFFADFKLLPETPIALFLGFLIGIGTGLIGAGGGLMILLALVFVLDFPLHIAIGTSTLIMAVTATSGVVGYALQDNLNLLDGLIAGGGAAVGGLVSALFANHVDERTLTRLVSGFFVLFGVVMTGIYFLGG